MNEQFIADYQWLEGQGTIRGQVDVHKSTGYSETMISLYLNQKRKASPKFLEAFYKAYNRHLNVKKDEKIVNNIENTSLHHFSIDLTEGKKAIIQYPKDRINSKDLEILKTAVSMIGMAVEGHLNNN